MAKSKRPKPPRTIQEIAADLYPDPELQAAVIQSATEAGTVEQVEDGILTLPHPADAARWHEQQKADKANKDTED